MAAVEANVRPVDAVPVLRCGTAAGACADGVLPGRPDDAQPGAGPRVARGQSEPVAGGHASGQSPAYCLARLEHRDRHRSARVGSAGETCPGLARTARCRDPRHLSSRTVGESAARFQRAGCEPERRNTTCQHLWRPRPLLHLPYSRHRRHGQSAGAVRRGARDTGTGCRRSLGAAGLPGAAARRCLRGAAAAGELAGGSPPSQGMATAGRGAVHRGIGRGHAGLQPGSPKPVCHSMRCSSWTVSSPRQAARCRPMADGSAISWGTD